MKSFGTVAILKSKSTETKDKPGQQKKRLCTWTKHDNLNKTASSAGGCLNRMKRRLIASFHPKKRKNLHLTEFM